MSIPKPPMGGPCLGGIDLPSSGVSLHLHGLDQNTLTGGYFKTLGTNEPASYRYLNGYEAAMADYYAGQINLPKWQR